MTDAKKQNGLTEQNELNELPEQKKLAEPNAPAPQDGKSSHETHRRRHGLRTALVLTAVFLTLFAAMLGASAWMLFTAQGLNFAAKQASSFVPGFHVAKIEGDWTDLRISNLSLDFPGIRLDAGLIRIGLDWHALFDQRVHVTRFALSDATAAVETAKLVAASTDEAPEPESDPLAALEAPLPIAIDEVKLERIAATVDGMSASVGLFSGGAAWTGRRVDLSPVTLEAVAVALPEAQAESDAAEEDASAEAVKPAAPLPPAIQSAPPAVHQLAQAMADFSAARGEAGKKAAAASASAEAPSAETSESSEGMQAVASQDGPVAPAAEGAAQAAADVAGDAAEKPPVNPADEAKALVKHLQALFAKPLVETLPTIEVPLEIHVASIRGADWTLSNLPGAEAFPASAGLSPLRVERFEFSGEAEKNLVKIGVLALKSSVGEARFAGRIELADAWPLSLEGSVSADAGPFVPALGLESAPAAATLRASGSVLKDLAASVAVTGFVQADLEIKGSVGTAGLPFSVALSAPELRWPLPGSALEAEILALEAKEAEAAKAANEAQAAASAARKAAKTAQTGKAANAAQQAKPAQRAQSAAAAADAASGAAAESAKPAEAPAPAKPPRFAAKALAFSIDGRADDYSIALSADVEADVPAAGLAKGIAGHVNLAASGGLSRASIADASFAAPEGTLALSGAFSWSEGLSWQAKVDAKDLKAQAFFPKLPLELSAGASSEGAFSGWESWRAAASGVYIDGTIQGAPIRLRADGSLDSARQVSIPGISLLLGKNTVSLKGKADGYRALDFDMQVDVPGLLNTIPGLRGTADGFVRVTGSIGRPQVKADLRAKGLGWQEAFSLANLKLVADIENTVRGNATKAGELTDAQKAQLASLGRKLTDEEIMAAAERAFLEGELKGSLSLSLDGIEAAGQQIKRVTLAASGREGSHTVNLAAAGGPVEGKLALKGAFDRKTLNWKGALEGTSLRTPAGVWTQAGPAPLEYQNAKQTVILGKHCWNHAHAQVCVAKPAVIGRAGHATIALTKLDMSLFKAYLKKRDRLKGNLKAELEAQWDLAKKPLPDMVLAVNGDGIEYSTRYQGVRFPLTLAKLRMRGSFQENRVQLDYNVQPDQVGKLFGRLILEDPMKARRLSGRIIVKDVTPSLLKPFLSTGEKAEGTLNADLRAGGTLASPEMTGALTLAGLQLDAAFIPVDMKPSNVEIAFEGQKSTLTGTIATQSGDLHLEGSADWSDLKNWQAAIRAYGDKIRLSIPPMVQVDVTPDVSAKATPALVSLAGQVDVPWARIVVGELPKSGTSVSADEVILEEDGTPRAAPSSPIALQSKVMVKLGDRITIDAFGLKAALTGGLYVVQSGDSLGVTGQVKIPYGRFHAYGQDLIVRKGTVTFSGAAENPGLSIEAIRNPESTEDDVTAGIRVTGTASNPKVDLFSEPAKSQTETLSYILTGHGFESDEEGSMSSTMTSMLVGLGASSGNGIIGDIGDAVGIKGLGIDTTGVGDSSQVVVSGYVLPGLQVKYGMGIFDSLATLTLRYRVMPKLYLEAVTGVEQALDLLYRFDF